MQKYYKITLPLILICIMIFSINPKGSVVVNTIEVEEVVPEASIIGSPLGEIVDVDSDGLDDFFLFRQNITVVTPGLFLFPLEFSFKGINLTEGAGSPVVSIGSPIFSEAGMNQGDATVSYYFTLDDIANVDPGFDYVEIHTRLSVQPLFKNYTTADIEIQGLSLYYNMTSWDNISGINRGFTVGPDFQQLMTDPGYGRTIGDSFTWNITGTGVFNPALNIREHFENDTQFTVNITSVDNGLSVIYTNGSTWSNESISGYPFSHFFMPLDSNVDLVLQSLESYFRMSAWVFSNAPLTSDINQTVTIFNSTEGYIGMNMSHSNSYWGAPLISEHLLLYDLNLGTIAYEYYTLDVFGANAADYELRLDGSDLILPWESTLNNSTESSTSTTSTTQTSTSSTSTTPSTATTPLTSTTSTITTTTTTPTSSSSQNNTPFPSIFLLLILFYGINNRMRNKQKV